MTVTSDSACNNPAYSSVWSSSTSNPLARTLTLRILCSMGSSQPFFSWSNAFNSLMVVVGTTLTVRSPPSKVFTFTSHCMTAMAARKASTRNLQNVRCYCWWKKTCTTWDVWNPVDGKFTIWTDAGFLNHQQYFSTQCTICEKFGGSVVWDEAEFRLQDCRIAATKFI